MASSQEHGLCTLYNAPAEASSPRRTHSGHIRATSRWTQHSSKSLAQWGHTFSWSVWCNSPRHGTTIAIRSTQGAPSKQRSGRTASGPYPCSSAFCVKMSAPGPCSPLKLNAATAAKWMRNGSTIGPKRGESNAMPPLKSRSDPRTAGSHCESRSSVQPSIASQRSACSCACSPARSRSMTAAGLSHTRLLSTALRMVRASCVSSPAEGQLLNAGTLITSCQPP
mmetsp:Transcript_1904/g.5955  ORF Transcript_1904/g.5955 Transcript_1904/m.5955 type:complete len:224 (-) Transcript_1904:548-1219(-)